MRKIVNSIWKLLKSTFLLVDFSITGILTITTAIINGLWPESKSPYQARLVPEGDLVSIFYSGLFCTGLRRLKLSDSYRGQLVCGPPGSQKTVSTIMPFLLDPTGTIFILDPSNELWEKSSGSLAKAGYALKRIRFTAPFHDGFNPLIRCQGSPSSIRRLSNMLYTAQMQGKESDPFWRIQAESLIALLIELVLEYPKEYHNLYNVFDTMQLLSSNVDAFDNLVISTKNERVFQNYAEFNGYDDKLKSNILASVKAALIEYSDPALARITSIDTLGDVASLREEKTAVFVSIPITEQDFFASLVSILFEQIFAELLQEVPARRVLPVTFLLEEAGIMKIPLLPTILTQARKFRISTSIVVQSEAQLEKHYGKLAEAIITSCNCKIYLAGQPIHKAKQLEHMIGRREVTDENGMKKILPILTADTIRSFPVSEGLMVLGSNRVSKIKLRPYYKRWKYKRRSELPPVQLPHEQIQLPPLLRNRAS